MFTTDSGSSSPSKIGSGQIQLVLGFVEVLLEVLGMSADCGRKARWRSCVISEKEIKEVPFDFNYRYEIPLSPVNISRMIFNKIK